MSVWDWVQDYRHEAAVRGDEERLWLTQAFHEAWDLRETDTDRAGVLLDDARRLAQALDEPRWVLFYDHWLLQLARFFRRDYRNLLDRAVRAALEARKPAFAELPQRICLQEDLVGIYAAIDPVGYEDLIAQALDYMEGQVTPELECRHCVQGCRTMFELDRGRTAEARAAGLRALELAEDSASDHYRGNAYANLCLVAFRAGDDAALREWACASEELARQTDRKAFIAEALLWRAVAARKAGDARQARRLCTAAVSRMTRLSTPPGEAYFDALAAFCELDGDLEGALGARDRELQAIAGRGHLAQECEAHVKRCGLLARLGKLTAADLAAARVAAGKLRKPEKYLAEIDRISADSAGP
jgi:hypothetical protein